MPVWWTELHEPVQIALIGLAGVIATILVANLVSIVVSRRQVYVAERTMFLSLIDRRSRWYDNAVDHFESWIQAQERWVEAAHGGQVPDTKGVLKEIGAVRREANWLFGPEIIDEINKLDQCVRAYGSARLAVRGLEDMPPRRVATERPHLHDTFMDALHAVMKQRDITLDRVRDYLYVGDLKAAHFRPRGIAAFALMLKRQLLLRR